MSKNMLVRNVFNIYEDLKNMFLNNKVPFLKYCWSVSVDRHDFDWMVLLIFLKFPECSCNLFLLMTAKATGRRVFHWKFTLRNGNQSSQIEPWFQSGLYSLRQSMSNSDKFNRWTHRETHLITLSFHLTLPATTAIFSHYSEQFSSGNFGWCSQRPSLVS